MPRRARIISSTGLYHVICRGIGRQIIFEDEQDHAYFLKKLSELSEEETCDVLAYCLMDNHVHLVIRRETGLDIFMKRVLVSYATYYNKKYERSGHVFQDRYKSEPIEDERYLLAVIRYVHDNPVKAGICTARDYPWCSHAQYAGKEGFVNTETVAAIPGGMAWILNEVEKYADAGFYVPQIDRVKKTDTEAREIMYNELGITNPSLIRHMEKKDRNAILRTLKDYGFGIRQIERLTGICYGVIQQI